MKGAKHQKTLNLHQRLGKPVPEIKMPAITASTTSKAVANIAQKEGKVVQVCLHNALILSGQLARCASMVHPCTNS